MTNYLSPIPLCRHSLGPDQGEEATGLLQRVGLLCRRLTLEFDWGIVYITLDASKARSAYQALKERVGSKVAVLLLIDDGGTSILKICQVRK
jgi:hypothetical protein